jgi:hypothetical protein
MVGSITNSGVEGTSWRDGSMNLLDFKNSTKRPWGQDVDLNMPHRFGAFISHLSPVILWLLPVSQFSQHLLEHPGDLASITSVMLELVNISLWKLNP